VETRLGWLGETPKHGKTVQQRSSQSFLAHVKHVTSQFRPLRWHITHPVECCSAALFQSAVPARLIYQGGRVCMAVLRWCLLRCSPLGGGEAHETSRRLGLVPPRLLRDAVLQGSCLCTFAFLDCPRDVGKCTCSGHVANLRRAPIRESSKRNFEIGAMKYSTRKQIVDKAGRLTIPSSIVSPQFRATNYPKKHS
jgi:hypothetical protein